MHSYNIWIPLLWYLLHKNIIACILCCLSQDTEDRYYLKTDIFYQSFFFHLWCLAQNSLCCRHWIICWIYKYIVLIICLFNNSYIAHVKCQTLVYALQILTHLILSTMLCAIIIPRLLHLRKPRYTEIKNLSKMTL